MYHTLKVIRHAHVVFLQLYYTVFILQNTTIREDNTKNLDPSYKIELALWDCFGREKKIIFKMDLDFWDCQVEKTTFNS